MVDRYTKVVLTVIAVALVWLCFWGPGPVRFGTPAEAGTQSKTGASAKPAAAPRREEPVRVEVVNWYEASLWPVEVTGRVEVDGPVRVSEPVEVTGTVEVEGAAVLGGRAGWPEKKVDVNIAEVGGNRVSGAGVFGASLPVTVKYVENSILWQSIPVRVER